MRLLDGFIPIFKHINSLSIQLASSEHTSTESLKHSFQEMLLVLDGEDFTSRYSPAQLESASFAVVALIDEKISETEWGALHNWSSEPLQKTLFSTLNAGELFFQRLDTLKTNDHLEDDVREIYLYCLKLGFCGRYFGSGENTFLQSLCVQQFDLLSSNKLHHKLFQVDEATPDMPSPIHPFTRMLRYDNGILLALITLVLVYVLLRADYFSIIQSLLSTLN